MPYTFEILGISPVLYFFNHQQEIMQQTPRLLVEYLGSHKCTLDAFLASIETFPAHRGWHPDQIVDTMIEFWMNNSDSIQYWKARLEDAGSENLLVARLAELNSLKAEFEFLLGKNF